MRYLFKKPLFSFSCLLLFIALQACNGGGAPPPPPPPSSKPPILECTFEMVEQRINLNKVRTQVAFEAARNIERNGRIITYKNFIFVNDHALGFHVFDNADTANPVALGFMRVPGNYDISIHNDKIYADSYIDLVVIGLSATGAPEVLSRKESAFDGEVKTVRRTEAGTVVAEKILLWRDALEVEEVCR